MSSPTWQGQKMIMLQKEMAEAEMSIFDALPPRLRQILADAPYALPVEQVANRWLAQGRNTELTAIQLENYFANWKRRVESTTSALMEAQAKQKERKK